MRNLLLAAQLVAFLLSAATLTCAAEAPPPKEPDWKVVEGDTDPYKALTAKEETLTGVILKEEDKRVASPMPVFRFYLKTADAKLLLIGDKDKLQPFADIPVSVKGKKTADSLWVGWVRKIAADTPDTRPPAPK